MTNTETATPVAVAPNRELAIAIAKDVLAQIRREDNPLRIGEQSGYMAGKIPNLHYDDDVRDHIEKFQANCRVCMLGGMFLSKARLLDDAPVRPHVEKRWGDGEIVGDRDAMVDQLSVAFSPADQDVIESAFEMGDMAEVHFDEPYGTGEWERHVERCLGAAIWAYRLKTNRAGRAVAICENIIANGGVFVVEPINCDDYSAERFGTDK